MPEINILCVELLISCKRLSCASFVYFQHSFKLRQFSLWCFTHSPRNLTNKLQEASRAETRNASECDWSSVTIQGCVFLTKKSQSSHSIENDTSDDQENFGRFQFRTKTCRKVKPSEVAVNFYLHRCCLCHYNSLFVGLGLLKLCFSEVSDIFVWNFSEMRLKVSEN